ncbi:MAG: His/Gly/Thr/Pro-type tRNA ligase C-terminal domain-containing protein [Polyangiaceae bacterium]
MPEWLCPEQVRVVTVHAEQREYAEEVVIRLRQRGLRVRLDASSETLGRRVAEAHSLQGLGTARKRVGFLRRGARAMDAASLYVGWMKIAAGLVLTTVGCSTTSTIARVH